MSSGLSHPGTTDPEAEVTEPTADTNDTADTNGTSDTVGTEPEATADADDALDAEDVRDAPDALDTPNAVDISDMRDAPDVRDAPHMQDAEAGAPVFFTGPPDDDIPLDGPLLPDATQLRGNWQQVQASFVDDPRGSVAEAAALVDHAAQALAGALQQRQRRLRESWDTADGAAGGASPGTEELRVAMRRYRALFDHICQP